MSVSSIRKCSTCRWITSNKGCWAGWCIGYTKWEPNIDTEEQEDILVESVCNLKLPDELFEL